MDADHGQFAGVFLFQFPQLREYMGAVDSTVGPEVEDDDFSPELLHGQRAIRVDPFQSLGEFRRGQFTGELAAAHGVSGISTGRRPWDRGTGR